MTITYRATIPSYINIIITYYFLSLTPTRTETRFDFGNSSEIVSILVHSSSFASCRYHHRGSFSQNVFLAKFDGFKFSVGCFSVFLDFGDGFTRFRGFLTFAEEGVFQLNLAIGADDGAFPFIGLTSAYKIGQNFVKKVVTQKRPTNTLNAINRRFDTCIALVSEKVEMKKIHFAAEALRRVKAQKSAQE